MATNAGLEVLTGPRDLDRARQDIIAAGYKGERVVLLGSSTFPEDRRCSEVGADMLKKVGFNVDFQLMDLGAWFQRLQKRTRWTTAAGVAILLGGRAMTY
jgi:peptide/nickel transport system substrate-binding protein